MSATHGQYFRPQDYAAFWRRLLVDTVDLLVFGAACTVQALVLWDVLGLDLLLALWAALAFGYFVLLKGSKIGTLGYWAGGVRIVGVDGRPPSVLALTLRLMFATLGPLNYFLDLVWLSSDPHRQALPTR